MNSSDLLESCKTETEQDALIMAVMMIYLGFINNDIKRARFGASMLVAAQKSEVSYDDVSSTIIASLDIYNREHGWFRKWERRNEFITFMMGELNRVQAIIHSTKIYSTSEEEKASAMLREALDNINNIIAKKHNTKEEE